MFVLRASPVFLGEMNGTATALVRRDLRSQLLSHHQLVEGMIGHDRA